MTASPDAGPRVLVVVPALWIEDGATLPAVDTTVDYPLTFVEVDETGDQLGDDLVGDWPVRAEALSGGPQHGRPLGGPAYGPTYWPVLLHGAGWAAVWHAPRPALGQLQLRGRLVADLVGRSDASVRGRVIRLWVMSETVVASDGDRPGPLSLHEVSVSPRWFDRDGHGRPREGPPPVPSPGATFVFGTRPSPPTPWVREVGVLVEVAVG